MAKRKTGSVVVDIMGGGVKGGKCRAAGLCCREALESWRVLK